MKSKKLTSIGEMLSISNDKIWLTMQARLSSGVTLEWISDVHNGTDEYLGMITLVTKGKRLLVADHLPEDACQALFNSLYDAYKVGGYSPVITYCSFD